jgi:hypothetical protein
MSVGGGRTFVEDPGIVGGALGDASLEDFFLLPEEEDFSVDFREVEGFEFSVHKCIFKKLAKIVKQKAPPSLQPAGAFRYSQNISASQVAGQRGNNNADDNGIR